MTRPSRVSRSPLVYALVFCLFLAAVSLSAGVRRYQLTEVVHEADRVLVGTVVNIETRWGENQKMIWTDYTFEVEDLWKGQPVSNRHVVSVAGGTHEGRTILLTHVPKFEMGGTYVVYLFDNIRLHAAPTVGVEQGAFREVKDVDTGEHYLIDYHGYRMEITPEGKIVRGPMTERIGSSPREARTLSQEELVALQTKHQEHLAHNPMPAPTYKDPYGREIKGPAPKPDQTPREEAEEIVTNAQRGTPLTRAGLKHFTDNVLNGKPPVALPAGQEVK